MKWFFMSLLALMLVACQPPSAPDLSIENARLRLPAPGQTTAVVYFDIVNKGGADNLLSAQTPVSERAELHTHLHENGIMKMRKVAQVNIPAGTTISFESGGLHVMAFGADIAPDMQTIPLVLNFGESESLQIDVAIQGR